MTELNFLGTSAVYNHHLAVPYRPLTPDAKKSVGEVAMDGNLVIEGDNLHALKSLLPLYAGKVDCIFIDPPYNTGGEWAYDDNVNAPQIKEWLDANPVSIEDNLRHDKWCAMMWPRLRLLHELLSDTGSLWMTIDDNEVHRVRGLLDEIFGQDNFIANIIWQKNIRRPIMLKAFLPRMTIFWFFKKQRDFVAICCLEPKNKMTSIKMMMVMERVCGELIICW